MPTITTIGGWAAILAITGTYYWVNKQRKQKNLRALNPKLSSKGAEPRKHTKAKKGKKDGALSGSEASQKKNVQQPAQPAAQQPIASVSVSKKAERDEKDDDRKFALQMANTKRGVADAPKSQNSARTKSVKQAKAQEKPAVELPSESGTAPSSTTGVDADDDQSPINSPELSATATAPINGDVSDMLEKPTDGPSVLRVTAPINSQPKKAKKPQSFEVKETKKQKQNRKKAEEKKQAREEDEKARKAQLESHRRSVREAEGRAAKDGSTFMASQVPSSSAWTAAPAVQATNGNNIAPSKEVELLDTYEPTNGHVASKPIEEIYSESEIAGSRLQEELSRIPEEEQIRVAKEESGHWEEVKTKTRKNKVTTEAPKDIFKNVKSNKLDTSSSNDDSGDFGVPPVVEPTGPGKKWVQNVAYVAGNGKVVEREMEIQDSEWEVA